VKTIFIAVRALIVMVAFLWLWAWVALGLRRYDSPYNLQLPDWTNVLAIPVMLAGAALAVACVATFVVIGRGTPAPFDPPRQFVAVGLYRYVRNPMYIGGALLLAGFALYLRSGAALVFCFPWLLLAHIFVLAYEEPSLRSKFGAPYETYCRTVPRWIPRFRPRREQAKTHSAAPR
jgi:protein-S-isoprenylcysteine O-methyltransferase Ste14